MSYYIEFDRVFIRSVSGYTPLWLLGDSSMREGSGRSTRVYRRWNVFQSLIGVREDDILDAVNALKGSSEHWQRNGKWINDKDLDGWVRNGCKHAVVLEDLLRANDKSSLLCALYRRQGPGALVLRAEVHNTPEMDEWIYRAKKAISDDPDLAPLIEPNFGERLRRPGKERSKDPEEKVVIKHGQYYLAEISDRGNKWTKSRKNAQIYRADEAAKVLKTLQGYRMKGRAVSASVLDAACNFIVACNAHDSGPTRYICQLSSRGFRYSLHQEVAKRYSTRAAAKRAMESAKQRFPSYTFEVLELEEKPA